MTRALLPAMLVNSLVLAAAQSQEIAEPQSQEIAEPQSQEIAEPQSQEIAEPQSQEIAEPQSQEIVDSQTQEIVESQTQEIAEPQSQEAIESPESKPADNEEVHAFRQALAGIESDQGAYAQALPEQLISLGQALQQQGRHNEAAAVFKRGVHLARINNGLHSAEQIPFIKGEITSNVAVGDLVEADQRQQYLLSVQQRSLGSGDLYVQAMMQHADWHYSAYKQGIGEKEHNFGRLLSMLDLYRLAINDILEREGASSLKLLRPLHEMLRAQYVMSTYQESSGQNLDSNAASERFRFNSYRMQNFKRGNSVILTIFNLQQSRFGEHSLPATQSLAMLGDWMLWHDKRDSANVAYKDALRELAELDDAQIQIEHMFGEPVALPNIDGIRPLPAPVAEDQGDILLEFRVNARGRVIELQRVDEHEHEDEEEEGQARRLMRKLRKVRFRPRFAEGEPVVTEKIVRAYEFVH